jgi:hypothetical protein
MEVDILSFYSNIIAIEFIFYFKIQKENKKKHCKYESEVVFFLIMFEELSHLQIESI